MTNVPFLQGVAAGAIRSGTSVFYGALGEVVVERAGMVNLGLEGTMLVGACLGFITASRTGNAYLGVLAAALAGGLFNQIFGFLVVTRRANQLASGLTMLLFALGLTAILGTKYVDKHIDGLDRFKLPLLSSIRWVGPVLFEGDVLTFGILPAALLIWWLLYRTRWGLHLRTVGESRLAAYAAGLSPARVQYQALFVGGMLGGIGGAHLSLVYTLGWKEGMTSGRGFIAVALVIFASWSPWRVILGAALYGGSIAFELQLQARNTSVPTYFLDMLPYLLTLLVLFVYGRNQQNQAPAGLAEVFA